MTRRPGKNRVCDSFRNEGSEMRDRVETARSDPEVAAVNNVHESETRSLHIHLNSIENRYLLSRNIDIWALRVVRNASPVAGYVMGLIFQANRVTTSMAEKMNNSPDRQFVRQFDSYHLRQDLKCQLLWKIQSLGHVLSISPNYLKTEHFFLQQM